MYKPRMRGTCAQKHQTHNGDNNHREAKLRLGSRKPKQPVTWVPAVIQLFNQKPRLTSQELAVAIGKHFGGDAVTRCRQIGIPITAVGFAPGSDRTKLYALDVPFLWFALEEALQQINRYARILNNEDHSAQYPTFRTMAMWIQHIHQIQKTQRKPTNKEQLIMKSNIHQEFPEVKGKVVEAVKVSVQADFYGITIRFEDKTALAFSIGAGIVAFPTYADWTDGEEKIIKEYKPVRSGTAQG